MMRFLKSTLFPRSKPQKKIKDQTELTEVAILKKRVELLEEENQKSAASIKELSSCIRSLSLIIAEMSADMSSLTHYVSSLTSRTQEDDIISRYLTNLDDDDDGYLN